VSAAVAFLFITFLHILIGELVPKAYAIRATEQVALWTALPMRAFQVTVKPALWFLDRTATLVLRWLRVDFKHGTEAHSEEELRMLLANRIASARSPATSASSSRTSSTTPSTPRGTR
jgi:CBS domain containing-hemolysin-like protein